MPEVLDAPYQPSAYDPSDKTVLRRFRFAPDPVLFPGRRPTVLTIHAGEFKEYDAHGSVDQTLADYDLVKAGFLVFSIDYRLAPPGRLHGQHLHDNTPEGIASGRPPQQSNDVKQEILAAYNDDLCNGEIFLLGGSSGGTHALWCALDPNPLPAPATGWPLLSGTIKAVVGLSGVYDLTLRTSDTSPTFINDVHNYTNSTDNFLGFEYQWSASPYALVVDGTATTFPPIRLYATDGDSVPPKQAENMMSALQAHGADVLEYTLSNSSDHAFRYWHHINDRTQCA